MPHIRIGLKQGLSPRVRGKLPMVALPESLEGSIPACAGEACSSPVPVGVTGVYPRVCGGSCCWAAASSLAAGLSPRVRGKLFGDVCGGCGQRSIPACAGEAVVIVFPLCVSEVYPRVCGGSPENPYELWAPPGLSPRVRGKLPSVRDDALAVRSIPACAGEALSGKVSSTVVGVYPRVCGGSRPVCGGGSERRGLSPRVRGKPRRPGSALS